jgi:hypothetical protein
MQFDVLWVLKSVNISLVGILLAFISLAALAGDLGTLSTSPSNITTCTAYYGGSITYVFAVARIDSSGYYGEGYVEVGLLPSKAGHQYGYKMEIKARPNSGRLAYAEVWSTGLPYAYIHSYKKPVFDHTLFSWGETYIGSLDGPLDASAGAGATISGWCIW